jgi:ferrous iron transport protein A
MVKIIIINLRTKQEADNMTLKDAKLGMTVKIEGLEESGLKERLMSMGFIKGTLVKVLRSAPLGDPMAVSLRSYNLSLRLADAEKIKVSLV